MRLLNDTFNLKRTKKEERESKATIFSLLTLLEPVCLALSARAGLDGLNCNANIGATFPFLICGAAHLLGGGERLPFECPEVHKRWAIGVTVS
jgi:hypothetical protein